jgi:hypothetical protein
VLLVQHREEEQGGELMSVSKAINENDRMNALIALRAKIAETIDGTDSGRDIAALSKRLMEVMEEIDQEMSLEKKQSKLEKISKLATGIKIIQGQPLPGSARNASYCANTRGESMALQSKLKSEGLGRFFPSSHLFLQEGSGACPWNPTSSCSPHSQVFSLKHAAPDSRG